MIDTQIAQISAISLIIIIAKEIQEIRLTKLLYSKGKVAIILSLIYMSTIVLIIADTFREHNPILPSTVLVICFVFRRYISIFPNNLQNHYEGIFLFTILLAVNRCFLSSFTIASCLYLSSFSAGRAKLTSMLWTYKGNGFSRFLQLPWLSRPDILTFAKKYKKKRWFEVITKSITLMTPYNQIIAIVSPIIALITFLAPSQYNHLVHIFIAICFLQGLFAFLLFVIADLTWITSFYTILVIINAIIYVHLPQLLEANNYMSNPIQENFSLYCSIVYFIAYSALSNIPCFYRVFPPKFLYTLSLPTGLFEMFTERNIESMTTFNSQDNSLSLRRTNVFSETGERLSRQNFYTRALNDLIYPLGDMLANSYEQGSETPLYISDFNERQCRAFFRFYQGTRIVFTQHYWDQINQTYYNKVVSIIDLTHSSIPSICYVSNVQRV